MSHFPLQVSSIIRFSSRFAAIDSTFLLRPINGYDTGAAASKTLAQFLESTCMLR